MHSLQSLKYKVTKFNTIQFSIKKFSNETVYIYSKKDFKLVIKCGILLQEKNRSLRTMLQICVLSQFKIYYLTSLFHF